MKILRNLPKPSFIIAVIRRCFGYYPYMIEHEGDGYYDHFVEMFKEEKPFLLKTLNSLRKKKIIPKVGEMLYGNDNVYYIKSICYYETHCCFWVDEDEHRSKNNA